MSSLSTALTTMRRSPYQSLTAITITAVTMFVAYSFSLMVIGTEQILQYFESRPQVIGFFQLDAETAEINRVAEAMEQKPYVESIKLVTQEQALDLYREDNREDPLLLELVTADILPASIEISAPELESLKLIKNDLEQEDKIEEVVFQQDIIDSLTSWTTSVRYIGITLIAILAVTSFLIISALIGIKVATQKTAIRIMRIIGASRWYIKSPFFFEGIIYGLTGSLLGWIFMFTAFLYLTPWLKEFLGDIVTLPVPWEVFAIQLSAGTLTAMLLGGLAGSSAVQKMIRK